LGKPKGEGFDKLSLNGNGSACVHVVHFARIRKAEG
jgi:hypothetical protein